MTTPGRVITIAELGMRAIWIDIIPEGKHCARDTVKQLGRLSILFIATLCDISRSNKHVCRGKNGDRSSIKTG